MKNTETNKHTNNIKQSATEHTYKQTNKQTLPITAIKKKHTNKYTNKRKYTDLNIQIQLQIHLGASILPDLTASA